MARPRRTQRTSRIAFDAVALEGGLIAPAMVARIADRGAGEQKEADYRIPKGLALRDEIARSFRIGQALFRELAGQAQPTQRATLAFVEALLRDVLGFDRIERTGSRSLEGRSWPVTLEASGGRVPVVVVPAGNGLDTASVHLSGEGRRWTASAALQDWLNASDGALWGLATDGRLLRLQRDNASFTRPAYVEADLATMFEDEAFADFALLWLLIHATRFGPEDRAPSDCPLERWREDGAREGVAARDRLYAGVEQALRDLGNGFLAHPDNGALRERLRTGDLGLDAYFGQLLRLVYRLIFLFAAEDRGLLHPPGAADEARALYAQGYALGVLRDQAVRRAAWDRHHDRWEGLRIVFAGLAHGEPRLGLPALGGLFAPGGLSDLDDARIANRDLMAAIYRLAWLREPSGLVPVNWRDMQTEELGSVYEGLLELTPRLAEDGRAFDFAEGAEAKGNQRKTTGSYYTPDSLVQLLLDSTLDPVLDAAETRHADDPVAGILELAILDPACGSGHFLLGAARRAAGRIARHRSGGAPTSAQFQHALREVVSHCIYGVDRNPMAVELARVALWIEALEPGKPLSFLDSHIRCGDSLIGVFDYACLRDGIPDGAYKPLTGDDKPAAKGWDKANCEQRDGKGATGFLEELRQPAGLVDAARAVMAMPEESLEEIAVKRRAFETLHQGRAWLDLRYACNLWVAAFFAPKTGAAPDVAALARPSIPLTGDVWTAARGKPVYGPLLAEADAVAQRVAAFHWPLEFPHVFARGGFDAVVGNPPWEVSQLGEQEYFAARAPEIAALAGDARKRAIARLEDDNPRVWAEYRIDKRVYDAANEFFRDSGRFDLTAVGKINTYALFAEHFLRLARPEGRSGVIVPTGIATDSSTSRFFGHLVASERLARIIDFENRERLFAAVDSRMKFCTLTMGGADRAEFAFFLTDPAQLEQAERRFTLAPAQIARINPNTRTAPVFRSRADAELTATLYERAPVLIEERPEEEGGDINPWGITFQQGLFNMTSASEHFATASTLTEDGWQRDGGDWVREGDGDVERRVPLYEAKMIHHFDHRWATYAAADGEDEEGARDCTVEEKRDPAFEPTPRYWVPEGEVRLRAARVPAGLKRALREDSPERILKSIAEWLAGWYAAVEGRAMAEADLHRLLGRDRPWRTIFGAAPGPFLLDAKTRKAGEVLQRDTPLDADDLIAIAEGPGEPADLALLLIDRKQPRWLMGWRDITNATNERTVVGGLLPMTGVGNNLPIWYPDARLSARKVAILAALLSSVPFDFVARHKVGGTHLNFFIAEQLPALPPEAFTEDDLAFVAPHVLELTYTSHAMRPWAEDLAFNGQPFGWDEARRAGLRAELDAFFARKWDLNRDELRYVLDPADARGPDYPSETFRVLKQKEEARFGEYRTRRLVLEAFDRLTGG